MSERRQHERFELLAHVQLAGQVETLATINISAGGILLRNDQNAAFAIGDSIKIGFATPIAPAFAIEAIVVRVIAPTNKPALLAAMWTSSDPVATNALVQLLWNLRA